MGLLFAKLFSWFSNEGKYNAYGWRALSLPVKISKRKSCYMYVFALYLTLQALFHFGFTLVIYILIEEDRSSWRFLMEIIKLVGTFVCVRCAWILQYV